MSNHNWVCFACRLGVRRPPLPIAALEPRRDVRCPGCGQACWWIGHRWRLPPRQKVKEWMELRERFFRIRHAAALRREIEVVRERHATEREIVRLEALPESPRTKGRIRELKKRMPA